MSDDYQARYLEYRRRKAATIARKARPITKRNIERRIEREIVI